MIQSIIGTSFKGGFTTDFLIFGLKSTPTTPPDDYMLFNLQSNNTVTAFTTNGIFYGPTVFANNPNDGFKYFVTTEIDGSGISFGRMSDSGEVTILYDDLLDKLGGSIQQNNSSVSFIPVVGTDNTYSGVTGSTTLGYGYGANFDIIVSGGTVSSVIISNNSSNDLYKIGDTISVSADKIGGSASQNLIITVNNIQNTASPTSLYYEGGFGGLGGGVGQFIYMDRALFFDNNNNNLSPRVTRIYTNGDVDLVTVDNVVYYENLYPTSLFTYQGNTWGVFTSLGLPLALVSKYNIATGLIYDVINEIIINNIPGISMSKVWFVISAINVNGRIYCNLVVNDKETNNSVQCIAELNLETGEADYLYSIPLDVEGGEYLYTNIINK